MQVRRNAFPKYVLNNYFISTISVFIIFQYLLSFVFVISGLPDNLPLYLRDLSFFVLFLMIFTKTQFRLLIHERYLLLYFLASIAIVLKSTSLSSSILSLRLYVMPFLLYCIGRYVIPERFKISLFFDVITFIFLLVGFFFLILSFNDELFNSVKNSSLGPLFSKGNLYVYQANGDRYHRYFGPFLDPLATAFFIVPLISFYYFNPKNLKSGMFLTLLSLYLLLTMTKAVIGSVLVVFLLIQKKNSRWKISTKLLFYIIPALFIFIIFFYEILIENASPSTYGHLFAYYSNVRAFIKNPMGYGYFRFSDNLPIEFYSTESIYFSIILEQGILVFMIFASFILKLLSYLKSQINIDTNNVILYCSLCIYLIASFTTEHFFATTSSFVFWLILGHMASKNSQYDTEHHNRGYSCM